MPFVRWRDLSASARYGPCLPKVMSYRPVGAKSPRDSFAWHYAFFARLASRRAPGSAVQLLDLTQAVHAFRGHLDPIRVADEVLLTWPFDVREPGA